MAGSDPREARLPKWAQAELDRLRGEVTRLREDFEEYADATMPDDVVALTNPTAAHPRPAAREGETVRFLIDGPDGYRWADVSVDPIARHLRVLASGGLRIEPHVTNHLTLSLTRD